MVSRSPGVRRVAMRLIALACLIGIPILGTSADSLYKYRDENGVLVYADRPPESGRAFERQTVASGASVPPVVTFRRERSPDGLSLWVDNPCYCVAEVGAQAMTGGSPSGLVVRRVVPAQSTTRLSLPASISSADEVRTGWVFGDPEAVHAPPQPYRPPFAGARKFPVSQAWPDARTHSTPDSQHAVDIVMPEQTAVFAARGGTVVEVAHRNFRGGDDRDRFGAQANLVRILHDDGSFALYAHLSWDSIRVRPGQRVARGEPIAASGNTGFSTGPHLHFVVVRNAGLRIESVPVTFSAEPGQVVTPQTGGYLQNP